MGNIVLFVAIFISYGTITHAQLKHCRASPAYVINQDAKARFSVIVSIRKSLGNKECDGIEGETLYYLSTIHWAVQKINNARYIPLLDLGFDVYDDCGLDRYSAFGALGTASVKFPEKLRKCSGNDTTYDLGILGASRSQTTSSILSMLSGTNVPVVSASASLPSLTEFPNFFRTTPADDDQVKVILELVKDLGWTYIAALHTDDNYGRNGIDAILKLAKQNGICIEVVKSIHVTEDFEQSNTLDTFFKNLTQQQSRAANNKLGIIYFGQKNVIEQLLIRTNQFKSKYRGFHWIMSDFVGTSLEVFRDAADVSNGTLTVSTSSIYIKKAHDFFSEKWNKVSTAKAQNKQNINFDGTDRLIEEFITQGGTMPEWRNDFTMPIVDAVYVIASALKDALQKFCPGYKTVCVGFQKYLHDNLLKLVENTSVRYGNMNTTEGPQELININRTVSFYTDGNIRPDMSSPLYDVNLYSVDSKQTTAMFTKVGNYQNGTLTLNESAIAAHKELSTCAADCPKCMYFPPIPYQYMEGDFLLMGIFSIHDPVEKDGFACGQFRDYTHDVIGVEAFFHAIQEVRNATGIKFGGIAFDDCYSPARGGLLVSQFFSGSQKLETDTPGVYIDPKKVICVIGPYPSGVTVPLNFLFTRLQLPAIAYSSSSPDLDDKINFPYFLRTVPSDVTQADAMVALIKSMGWTKVGIIYVSNNYGSKGKEAFISAAKANKICVTAPIAMSEADNDVELFEISLKKILESTEQVFVYFGTENRIIDLLENIKSRLENLDVSNNFVFIGSDAWGASSDVLKHGKAAQGSITFTFDSFSVDNDRFGPFMRTKKPLMHKQNSWLREFWREHFKCDPEGDFDKKFGVRCAENQKFSEADINEFVADQRIQHIMNAVYAAGYGLKDLRDQNCSGQLSGCKLFSEQPDNVLRFIKNVKLQTKESNGLRVFDSNGNGNIGFNILNLKIEDNKYLYEKVGSYHQSLSLDKKKISSKTLAVTSKCGITCACADEEVASTSTTSASPCVTVTETSDLRQPDIIIIAIVASTCLIVIIILVVVIACFCKLKDAKAKAASSSYVYYKNQRAEQANRNQQFVTPGDIKLINPQGSSGDIKDLGGFVNQGFSGSESYLHPQSTVSDPAASRTHNQSPAQENVIRNHLMHTPPSSPPSFQHPVSSPVRQKQRRKPNSPSSPNHGGAGPAFPPDLPPRDSENSPSGVPQNFKQYQLTNGYPRMGTNISNGSPTTVQSSPIGSDYNPLFGNQSNSPVMAGMHIQDSPTSPLPDTNHLNRRSQFASLKKKQKRLHSEASLNSTTSVEKISRV